MKITLEDQLYKAIILATNYHNGQLDKAGEPYILHPLRLVSKTHERKEQIVALLHDILEDTKCTVDLLKKYGFDSEIIDAIICLTRKPEETYDQFIERVSLNELAAKVKLLDLEDNMNLRRLNSITEKDIKRMEKYKDAYVFLYGVVYKQNVNKTLLNFTNDYSEFVLKWNEMYGN